VPITNNIKNGANLEVRIAMTNGDVILYDNCTTQPNADNDN
jgi:hypothetical protein